MNVCRRYAKHAGLSQQLYTRGTQHPGGEELLSHFATFAEDTDALVSVLGNRGRTSTRGGILKAEAASQYAKILVGHGVETLSDVERLLGEEDRLRAVEQDLSTVPGHGTHGVRLGYLWMLAGDDTGIKPDRMVLAWLSSVCLRPIDVPEARVLVLAAAHSVGRTPWELDHAIWCFQRSKGK